MSDITGDVIATDHGLLLVVSDQGTKTTIGPLAAGQVLAASFTRDGPRGTLRITLVDKPDVSFLCPVGIGILLLPQVRALVRAAAVQDIVAMRDAAS